MEFMIGLAIFVGLCVFAPRAMSTIALLVVLIFIFGALENTHRNNQQKTRHYTRDEILSGSDNGWVCSRYWNRALTEIEQEACAELKRREATPYTLIKHDEIELSKLWSTQASRVSDNKMYIYGTVHNTSKHVLTSISWKVRYDDCTGATCVLVKEIIVETSSKLDYAGKPIVNSVIEECETYNRCWEVKPNQKYQFVSKPFYEPDRRIFPNLRITHSLHKLKGRELSSKDAVM